MSSDLTSEQISQLPLTELAEKHPWGVPTPQAQAAIDNGTDEHTAIVLYGTQGSVTPLGVIRGRSVVAEAAESLQLKPNPFAAFFGVPRMVKAFPTEAAATKEFRLTASQYRELQRTVQRATKRPPIKVNPLETDELLREIIKPLLPEHSP